MNKACIMLSMFAINFKQETVHFKIYSNSHKLWDEMLNYN